MAIEPITGFYVHDEETNTDGVAKVSIEAVQEFEDDIRDETANWLENNPDIWSPVPDDSLTTEKYKDDSVTGAKLANAAVTTEKIENGSVTEDKINFPVSVSHAFLTALDNKAFQGEYWGTGKAFQSVAYNPNTETYVLAYSGSTYADDGLLVEIDADFQFLRRAIVNAGHLNDLTYIPEKDVYFVANSYGTGKVAVVNPSTLTISETITIPGAPSTIDQISYNENVGDLFFTSNRTIYKSDLDFTNVIEYGEQETAKMTDSPYKNIDTRYLQGSCAFNDQFVSAWWLGVADLEEGASYNRICLFDTAGTFVRFFDHMSQDEIDELEGLTIVGGKILSFGYTGSNITVSAIFLNGETGGPNNPITFERVRYVTSSSILEDIHENAVRNTAYAYIVAFRNEHPVLGGVNGTLFGCKTSAGYGWQVFISPNKTATRRQSNGDWGNWALDVAQETTFWLGSKPFRFVRKGQTVTCYAPNDLNNMSSGETVVGTLGELFRPPYVVRARVQNNNANIYVTVETSGEVKIYCPSAITTAVNGAFHFSYVV